MTAKSKTTNLVWIDLEMTGLDPQKCTILEVGTVITDSALNILEVGPSIPVHHPKKVLDGMEPWSKFHHKKSGLTDACRESKISLKKAEEMTLQFVKKHCKKHTAPLCGNTIWQDRRFLVKYMPKLESYLHYRTIDVSSIKELVTRWYPADYKMPREKKQAHRAVDDVIESVEELRYYRSKVFVKPPQG